MFCSLIAEDKKATGSEKKSPNKCLTANQQIRSKIPPSNSTSRHCQELTNVNVVGNTTKTATHTQKLWHTYTHFIWDSARHCTNHLACHEMRLLSECAISTDTQTKKCIDDSSSHNWVASESKHHNSWIKQCQVTSHWSNTTSAGPHPPFKWWGTTYNLCIRQS